MLNRIGFAPARLAILLLLAAGVAAAATCTAANAVPVFLPLNTAGRWTSSDCRAPKGPSFADWYSFGGTAGQQIRITLQSSDASPYITLRDPTGTSVAIVQGTRSAPAVLPSAGGYYTLLRNGTYIIEATTVNGSDYGGYNLTVELGQGCAIVLGPTSQNYTSAGGAGSFSVITAAGCPWVATTATAWITINAGFAGTGSGAVAYTVAPNPAAAARSGSIVAGGATFTVNQAGAGGGGAVGAGGRFVPVAPCRAADTRVGFGPLGGPRLSGGSARSFPIAQSGCALPPGALAYSLNITVVPLGSLSYLTVWPTGSAQPFVSTLNAQDGRVTANAAVVPAGVNGAVSVFATNDTEVVIDVNGYFDSSPGAGSFYALAPCRVFDTRNPIGALGGPSMFGGSTRAFPVLAGPCGVSPAATAFSTNVTAVPAGPLSYLTLWPAGNAQPFVSTLNSPAGSVVANAAVVPAGGSGSLNVFVTNNTDVVLDINGYFAPPGAPGGLSFYPVTPCRVADTRSAFGPFGGPAISGGASREFPVPASACGIPAEARAYSLNVTVVPMGGLSYLTLWPAGQAMPFVSTLNSFDGRVVANAAIVPAGGGGSVSVFASNTTHVVLDINGYFAP